MTRNYRQKTAYTTAAIQDRVWHAYLDAGLEPELAKILKKRARRAGKPEPKSAPEFSEENVYAASMLLIQHRRGNNWISAYAQYDWFFSPAKEGDGDPDTRVHFDLDILPTGMSFEAYDGSARFHLLRTSGVSREVWPVREGKANPPSVLRGWLVPDEVLEALDECGWY